jgi:peptide-methionine (R)-S-oxide reductase
MDDTTLAVWFARGRIGLGLAAIAVPGYAARAISGRPESAGVEPLFARMLGARDLALGLGTAVALGCGTPVRGWLEVSALVDAADCASALLARKHMRPQAWAGTVVLASGSAALAVLLARRLDWSEAGS